MNKRIAEALVECGMYAEVVPITDGKKVAHYIGYIDEFNGTRDYRKSDKIDPFADTLEGRRQADALEDWLTLNHYPLWNRSELDAESPEKPYSENGAFWYQHRRNKLKWCFEQLEKDNEHT